MTDEKIIGGSWLLTLTTYIVEYQPILVGVSTSLTIVLTSMGIANYIIKWRKRKY
jgi:hypothetical protein